MVLSGAARGAGERIGRICDSDDDPRTMRLRLLAEFRRVVPFDAYAWVLTDPETSVGSAPLADVPSLADLTRLIRLRYLTPVNRWTSLSGSPVALLSAATAGELSRSLVWQELLCRYGVTDVASVVFRDRYGCWAFLELWRTGGSIFDPAEADFLREQVALVTTALRRGQARTFAATPSHGLQLAGPIVLLLSPDLEVVRQTPAAQDALRQLVPRDDAGPPVPAGAYNVAAQLLACEAGVDANPPRARVHLSGGLWLTLLADRWDGPAPRDERDIAVAITACAPADRISLFARASALTSREQELLGHLAGGADTREVAAHMFLSVHTVQDHLKSVFAKTGTRNRRTLLSHVLGG